MNFYTDLDSLIRIIVHFVGLSVLKMMVVIDQYDSSLCPSTGNELIKLVSNSAAILISTEEEQNMMSLNQVSMYKKIRLLWDTTSLLSANDRPDAIDNISLYVYSELRQGI